MNTRRKPFAVRTYASTPGGYGLQLATGGDNWQMSLTNLAVTQVVNVAVILFGNSLCSDRTHYCNFGHCRFRVISGVAMPHPETVRGRI